MNTHWTERLSEYIDNELQDTERAACDSHLAACEVCRTVLRELQDVTALARTDDDRVPPNDLWPGIVAQLQRRGVVAIADRGRRQVVFSLPQLALAASLLIAVSSGVAYLAASRVMQPSGLAQEEPIQAQAEPQMPASATLERANFADAQYDEAVADLEKILLDMRDELDPRTIMVIEKNLTVIDDAIQQARAALDADPANTYLNSHLADARRRKLELLRRATTIPSPSGD